MTVARHADNAPAATRLVLAEYSKKDLIPIDELDDPAPDGFQAVPIGGRYYLGPTHHVGIFPLRFKQEPHQRILVVVPKGINLDNAREVQLGLLYFMQLEELLQDHSQQDEEKNKEKQDKEDPIWSAVEGVGERLLLIFVRHYASALKELGRRDFRRYYNTREADLNGRIRGRLLLARHMQRSLHGKEHMLPCRWDEFTADNLDNRILKLAMDVLETMGWQLGGAKVAGRVRALFSPVRGLFSEVSSIALRQSDLRRTKLDRISPYYRRSLGWARLVLRGTHDFDSHTRLPSLSIDTDKRFEDLARRVTDKAMGDGLDLFAQKELPNPLLKGGSCSKPDLTIVNANQRIVAIGDAKYEEVLKWNAEAKDGELPLSPERTASLTLRSADLYQLYAYLRISQAPAGFFVVPYWDWGDGAAAARCLPGGIFSRSPLDPASDAEGNGQHRDYELAVFGLNLAKPPRSIIAEGRELLGDWLRRRTGASEGALHTLS